MILGKIRSGSLTSSAMLTESSKPTMAKKASVVPAVTATKIDRSSGVSKITTRDRSALPWVMAKKPTKITINNPLTSTSVSTMLTFTLSATPRKLISAMKQTAKMVVRPAPASSGLPPIQSWRTTVIIASKFAAKAREAVEADVMPEHMEPCGGDRGLNPPTGHQVSAGRGCGAVYAQGVRAALLHLPDRLCRDVLWHHVGFDGFPGLRGELRSNDHRRTPGLDGRQATGSRRRPHDHLGRLFHGTDRSDQLARSCGERERQHRADAGGSERVVDRHLRRLLRHHPG